MRAERFTRFTHGRAGRIDIVDENQVRAWYGGRIGDHEGVFEVYTSFIFLKRRLRFGVPCTMQNVFSCGVCGTCRNDSRHLVKAPVPFSCGRERHGDEYRLANVCFCKPLGEQCSKERGGVPVLVELEFGYGSTYYGITV
jgi:hypothetical protein